MALSGWVSLVATNISRSILVGSASRFTAKLRLWPSPLRLISPAGLLG